MRKNYTINLNISIRNQNIDLSWDEQLSREDIKEFFTPSDDLYNCIIILPSLFSPEEEAEFTDDEKADAEEQAQTQLDDFMFDVIINDSFDIWLEDLKQEYRSIGEKLPQEKMSEYEAEYNRVSSLEDKHEAVCSLYKLVEEMKA